MGTAYDQPSKNSGRNHSEGNNLQLDLGIEEVDKEKGGDNVLPPFDLSDLPQLLREDDAFGTDLDPNAIIASEENAEQNNIDKKQLEVIEGNIIDDKAVKDACGYECYDIVCANILADVLEPLSTCIHEHMKHGAYFITSGIIDTKENEVAEAFKKNPELEIVEINHDGEWVNITARRK